MSTWARRNRRSAGIDDYLRARRQWKVPSGRIRAANPGALWLVGACGERALGTYWNTPGVIDDVRRLVAYRTVEPYPLIAGVAIAEAVYRQANEHARVYFGISLLLTCGILLVMRLPPGASDAG